MYSIWLNFEQSIREGPSHVEARARRQCAAQFVIRLWAPPAWLSICMRNVSLIYGSHAGDLMMKLNVRSDWLHRVAGLSSTLRGIRTDDTQITSCNLRYLSSNQSIFRLVYNCCLCTSVCSKSFHFFVCSTAGVLFHINCKLSLHNLYVSHPLNNKISPLLFLFIRLPIMVSTPHLSFGK